MVIRDGRPTQLFGWLVDSQLGPQHRVRFKWRTRIKVAWLRLRHWRRAFRLRRGLRVMGRPLALALVGFGLPILFIWVLSGLYVDEVTGVRSAVGALFRGDEGVSRIEWRSMVQPLLLFIGVPAAFLLWAFRDHHINATLDNQRKDVNLKEFQELQMRAAGALSEKLPIQARVTLQVAALHQLRAFLRGEYGVSFRRPAFELLRARLAASAAEIGTTAIAHWLAQTALQPERHGGATAEMTAGERGEAIQDALTKLRVEAVAEAEATIVREEWQFIFRDDLPLAGSCFDRILLGPGALLAGLELTDCRFIASQLRRVHFELTNLRDSHFTGADLRGASFDCADLRAAHFESAQLFEASFCGSDLRSARFDNADLSLAYFESADLTGAQIDDADLRGARLHGADLTNASLQGSNLSAADLERAKLITANLQWALLVRSRLAGATLKWANLYGANLESANLRKADLSRASLWKAELGRADLRQAEMSMAYLRAANLTYAILEGACLDWASLDEADLTCANFESASLIGASLVGADLSGARLKGANLYQARLAGLDLTTTHLQDANLASANLSEANLSGVRLERARLKNANLEGANLTGSNLQGADLGGARLNGANLSSCRLEGAHLSAHFDNIDIMDASFDDRTEFGWSWTRLSKAEHDRYREQLRAAGARHVNDAR